MPPRLEAVRSLNVFVPFRVVLPLKVAEIISVFSTVAVPSNVAVVIFVCPPPVTVDVCVPPFNVFTVISTSSLLVNVAFVPFSFIVPFPE